MIQNLKLPLFTTMMLAAFAGHAEVVSSSSTHFVLRHEATTPLSPDAAWERLTDPASWWHPDHTYSGDSANLSLEVTAGGLWREDWDGGSVAHGRVLFVAKGRSIRLDAPFGPLQAVGAYTIWTITITPAESGAVVTFDEIATGPPTAKLDELAPAVDFVKGEAMRRLTGAAAP